MQNESRQSIRVEYTPEFKRNVRALTKKYRHIRSDVQPVLDDIAENKALGDQIKGTKYTVFKVRVRNSDIRKGKRAGYRLIYWLKTPANAILVTIYSKSDQGDISAQKIRSILKKYERRYE
jgi:mRNA-degrading endonuclease RelE of RelBE toxin-antitoxin system